MPLSSSSSLSPSSQRNNPTIHRHRRRPPLSPPSSISSSRRSSRRRWHKYWMPVGLFFMVLLFGQTLHWILLGGDSSSSSFSAANDWLAILPSIDDNETNTTTTITTTTTTTKSTTTGTSIGSPSRQATPPSPSPPIIDRNDAPSKVLTTAQTDPTTSSSTMKGQGTTTTNTQTTSNKTTTKDTMTVTTTTTAAAADNANTTLIPRTKATTDNDTTTTTMTMITNRTNFTFPTTTTKSVSLSSSPIVVGHVISFLNCGATLVQKYKDAMLILRHSIHQQSIHNTNTNTNSTSIPKSNYSYQMLAIVNQDVNSKCQRFIPWIQKMGYTPILRYNPVNISTITHNKYFQQQIDSTGVAGSSELLKLYLYTFTDYPIVVHWDIDVIVLQPMDDLFDAMLYPHDSLKGQQARSKLDIQQPHHQTLPHQIDAFFTRDIALARPWDHRQVAQGGFVVARPNLEVFEKYVQVIQQANYSAHCGNHGGWGNLGYGCKQGSMHYQGIVAYFYDFIFPNHAVELDVCKWNQVGHSVVYDKGPKPKWHGYCRQFPIYGGNITQNRPEYGACYDCRVLPIQETRTVHYTACAKPWQCRHHPQNSTNPAAKYAVTNSTTCGLLIKEFYKLRENLEQQLEPLLGPVSSVHNKSSKNAFYPEYFLGYCRTKSIGDGGAGAYVPMKEFPDGFEMKQLYGF